MGSVCLGSDLGMGALKFFKDGKGTEFLSQVSFGNEQNIGGMYGLHSSKTPKSSIGITLSSGEKFIVGKGAHDQARPKENFGFEKINGSSEMRALFYGGMSIAGRSLPPIVGSCLPVMIGWMITTRR